MDRPEIVRYTRYAIFWFDHSFVGKSRSNHGAHRSVRVFRVYPISISDHRSLSRAKLQKHTAILLRALVLLFVSLSTENS